MLPILFKIRDDIELRGYSKGTLTAYLRNCANYLKLLGDAASDLGATSDAVGPEHEGEAGTRHHGRVGGEFDFPGLP